MEDYHRAIEDFNKSIELNPADAVYYLNRGVSYFYTKQYQLAVDDANAGLPLGESLNLLHIRGLAYYELKQYQKSIDDLIQYLEVNPTGFTNSSIQTRVGRSYFELGQAEEAIKHYSKSIEMDPDWAAAAYRHRGDAFNGLGQHQNAIEDFNKAIEMMPSYAQAYYGRGEAHVALGDAAQAQLDFDKAKELGYDP